MPAGGCVKLGVAMITRKKWDELMEISKGPRRISLGTNKRLQAFEGLELEKLDRTDGGREVLEGSWMVP